MFTIIFTIIFMLILFIFYGNKKGFDKLETLWALYACILFLSYNYIPNKKFLLLVILYFRQTRTPFFFIIFFFMTILGGRFHMFRIGSLFMFNISMKLNMNTDAIPHTPTIFVANYPSNYVEYLTQGLFGDKVCLVVYGPAIKLLQYIHGRSHLISVSEKKGQFSSTQDKIKKKLSQGYHIFCYVERKYHDRSNKYKTTGIRSGIFSIAKNIGCTITPIVIDHIDHFNGILDNPVFNIHVDKTRKVENVNKEINMVSKLYKSKLCKFSFK
jgi:hypothetical protein